MENIILYHGSDHIIHKPDLISAKKSNDFGKGFYCTTEADLGREWACKEENRDGILNRYVFNPSGLQILDLTQPVYSVLNWIAILLKNRTFSLTDPLDTDAREYILHNFLPDTRDADVIIGYRADDSYFSFAKAFIQNSLPLSTLEQALALGNLGIQIVPVSKKALDQLEFSDAEQVLSKIWFPKFQSRDTQAREDFRHLSRQRRNYRQELFILDILREEMTHGDPRLQRTVSK